MYYRDQMAASVLKDDREHEYAWFKIRANDTTIVMAHCYRPPSDDVGVFDRLAEDIDQFGSTFPGAVIALLGDLNTHLRAWLPGTCHDNEAGKACHLLAVTHGLDQIVDEPTRY